MVLVRVGCPLPAKSCKRKATNTVLAKSCKEEATDIVPAKSSKEEATNIVPAKSCKEDATNIVPERGPSRSDLPRGRSPSRSELPRGRSPSPSMGPGMKRRLRLYPAGSFQTELQKRLEESFEDAAEWDDTRYL